MKPRIKLCKPCKPEVFRSGDIVKDRNGRCYTHIVSVSNDYYATRESYYNCRILHEYPIISKETYKDAVKIGEIV